MTNHHYFLPTAIWVHEGTHSYFKGKTRGVFKKIIEIQYIPITVRKHSYTKGDKAVSHQVNKLYIVKYKTSYVCNIYIYICTNYNNDLCTISMYVRTCMYVHTYWYDLCYAYWYNYVMPYNRMTGVKRSNASEPHCPHTPATKSPRRSPRQTPRQTPRKLFSSTPQWLGNHFSHQNLVAYTVHYFNRGHSTEYWQVWTSNKLSLHVLVKMYYNVYIQ